MPEVGDISSWPQALVAVVLIVALTVPTWINSHKAKNAAETARDTLTTNNGGSHVKDQLDRSEDTARRIEDKLDEHIADEQRREVTLDARISALEKHRRLRPWQR